MSRQDSCGLPCRATLSGSDSNLSASVLRLVTVVTVTCPWLKVSHPCHCNVSPAGLWPSPPPPHPASALVFWCGWWWCRSGARSRHTTSCLPPFLPFMPRLRDVTLSPQLASEMWAVDSAQEVSTRFYELNIENRKIVQ